MRSYLMPIIILFLAGVIFYLANSVLIEAELETIEDSNRITYNGGINALKSKKAELLEALDKAQELRKKVETLESRYNSFTDEQLERLDKMLPDNVDNVQLILDTNNIASLHSMKVRNVKITTVASRDTRSGANNDQALAETITRGSVPKQDALNINFTVSGSYREFLNFISDLQRSLRILDTSTLSFSSDPKDFYTYNVSLKTYWLK